MATVSRRGLLALLTNCPFRNEAASAALTLEEQDCIGQLRWRSAQDVDEHELTADEAAILWRFNPNGWDEV